MPNAISFWEEKKPWIKKKKKKKKPLIKTAKVQKLYVVAICYMDPCTLTTKLLRATKLFVPAVRKKRDYGMNTVWGCVCVCVYCMLFCAKNVNPSKIALIWFSTPLGKRILGKGHTCNPNKNGVKGHWEVTWDHDPKWSRYAQLVIYPLWWFHVT